MEEEKWKRGTLLPLDNGMWKREKLSPQIGGNAQPIHTWRSRKQHQGIVNIRSRHLPLLDLDTTSPQCDTASKLGDATQCMERSEKLPFNFFKNNTRAC